MKLVGIMEKMGSLVSRVFGYLPKAKRRPVFLALGGVLFLLLALLISTLVAGSKKTKTSILPGKVAGIPNEELFSPSEPDLLPGFLLEREPKHYWTTDDIRSYWKTPSSSELWQKEIKIAVDKLMEGVP